jgi:Reverse transcriptase (RNA-dependent DNA polymerase)
MLERVVAQRLKRLALNHNLFPERQFAAPGRCTTKALEYLLSIVYRGWCPSAKSSTPEECNTKVSMMTLDMTGAFDHVPRGKLLQVLVSMGIPYWMIKMLHSFVQHRLTSLSMPGYKSNQFWINIGVPQGSPLSPILFNLYTAGLLETLDKLKHLPDLGVDSFAFAFADDNHVVVTSRDFKTNCLAMEQLHDAIMEWANEHGMSFGPAKYNIMHFEPTRKPPLSPPSPSCHPPSPTFAQALTFRRRVQTPW